MFNFKLEYTFFMKNYAYIKALLLIIFWFFTCWSLSVDTYINYFLFIFEYHRVLVFSTIFPAIISNSEIFLSFYYPMVQDKKIFYSFFPDYFFLFLIFISLMFIAFSSHLLNYYNFQRLIKIIILGLFVEIWLLTFFIFGHFAFLLGNGQFILATW